MESEKALKYDKFQMKFSIWYHKAVAECLIEKFNNCRSSYLNALSLKDEDGITYLESLYEILASNGMVLEEDNPRPKPKITDFDESN